MRLLTALLLLFVMSACDVEVYTAGAQAPAYQLGEGYYDGQINPVRITIPSTRTPVTQTYRAHWGGGSAVTYVVCDTRSEAFDAANYLTNAQLDKQGADVTRYSSNLPRGCSPKSVANDAYWNYIGKNRVAKVYYVDWFGQTGYAVVPNPRTVDRYTPNRSTSRKSRRHDGWEKRQRRPHRQQEPKIRVERKTPGQCAIMRAQGLRLPRECRW